MDFIAALIITALFWGLIAYVAWLLVRAGRRLYYSGRWVLWLKRTLLVVLSGGLIFVATSDNPALQRFGAYLWLAFCLPFLALFILQLAFWLYNKVCYGSFLHETTDRGNVRVIYRGEEAKKREKKFCPICKRKTRCKVYDGKKGGVPFHRIRD